MAIGFNTDVSEMYERDNAVKKFNRVRLLKDIDRQINSLPFSSRSRKLLIQCKEELSK